MSIHEDSELQTNVEDVDHLQALEVTMFGKVYTLNPAADLALSASNLGECLQTHPSKYAFYASLRDLSESKVSRVNERYHVIRGKLDQKIRDSGTMPNGDRITEDALRRYLTTQDEVLVATKEIRQAQAEFQLLSSIVRAFEHRRECLIAMSNRQNNNIFHDKDVAATVAVAIQDHKSMSPSKTKVGAHPSKTK